MYRLTTIEALINRARLKLMLVVFAIAACISLAALSAPAQTPTQVGDYIFLTGNTVELTKGQTQGASVNVAGGLQLEMSMSLRRALYGDSTVVYAGAIRLVPGQRLSVMAPNSSADGSVKFLKHSIKIYEIESHGATENESRLVYSGESGGLNEFEHEYGHIFTLAYGDLPVRGGAQDDLWIFIDDVLPPSLGTQKLVEDRSVDLLLPTFKLIDEASGKTVLCGLLLPAIQKVKDKDGR